MSKLNFNLSLTQTLHYYVIHRHAQSQCQLSINRSTDVPIAVMCTRHEISVCLLGHSYIRRLKEFMNGNYHYYNLRLFTHLFDISCRAQGGLSIPRLIHDRSDLYNFAYTQPDIVYLQIGGNDMSTWDSSPVRVDPIILSFRKPFLLFYIYLLLANVSDFYFY